MFCDTKVECFILCYNIRKYRILYFKLCLQHHKYILHTAECSEEIHIRPFGDSALKSWKCWMFCLTALVSLKTGEKLSFECRFYSIQWSLKNQSAILEWRQKDWKKTSPVHLRVQFYISLYPKDPGTILTLYGRRVIKLTLFHCSYRCFTAILCDWFL